MRALQAMILGLGLASAASWAQAPGEPVPAKAAPPKAEAPKAAVPKKAEPKKAAPKKTEPRKAEPKKAEPPKKASTPPPVSGDPNVKVYKAGAKDAPQLRDKDGKVIPTNPDAYDVSSALKK
jgi:hypothetical protein